MANFVVIYDSCVLYPAPLRDLFMRLALTDLFQAKWTKDIHREGMRNLLKNRPDLTEERLELTRSKMDLHVRDCLVEGYEELIECLNLPDPNDRHVLAAAIKACAQTIVTYNLHDFPSQSITQYGINAEHPDEFLRHLLDMAPAIVMRTIQETRLSLKNPPKSSEEYLAILEKQSLPQTVSVLKDYANLI
ncbi:MAG: PIN domain-containing protein [Chlamydiae bacterium]|nr:PIN domain-containing protein [Chlamydiota bacterium]